MRSSPRPAVGRFVLAGAVAFLVAILMARLLLARGELWHLFVLALPVLLIGLSLAFGFVRALFLVGFFASTVLGARWVLQQPGAGWAVFVLLPVVLLAAILAGRVVLAILKGRRQERVEEGKEEER